MSIDKYANAHFFVDYLRKKTYYCFKEGNL